MSEPVKLIVIGCGSRGTGYSKFAEELFSSRKIAVNGTEFEYEFEKPETALFKFFE